MVDVSKEIASFFQDPEGSKAVIKATQHIAAPMVQGTPFTMDEIGTGGGIRVVMFVLDASPSMMPVAILLRDGFNTEFVPAVKLARESDISALRIGGVAFSSGDPEPIWVTEDPDNEDQKLYFHSLESLPQISVAEYDPSRGWGTALHRAIVDASTRAFRYAAEVQAETNIDVDVDVVILSDGANNEAPKVPTEVRQMITGRKKARTRFVFFYFETEEGLSTKPDPDLDDMSQLQWYAIKDLGIDSEQVQAFARYPNETNDERAKRFRRLMAVMSRVSATRGVSAVIATANVLDDDEIV